MKTGDHVFHKPSGETWVVAYVDGDELAPCGWPLSFARTSDCTLVRCVTDEESLALLKHMAGISGDDPRWRYARREIERRGAT